MKILQIATIFPADKHDIQNPYVKNFRQQYLHKYNVSVDIIKPVAYLPKVFMGWAGNKNFWKRNLRVYKKRHYFTEKKKIQIWPYVSVGSVSKLHAFFTYFVLRFNKKKVMWVGREQYDLIHAHFLFPDGMIAYQLHRKFGIPYILTLQQELRFFENSFSFKWAKKIIQQAVAVTTLSPHMYEKLKNQGFNGVQLLPMGIEGYFFDNKCHIEGSDSLQNEERRDISDMNESGNRDFSSHGSFEMTNSESKLKLLSVCHLLPIKNLEAVIKAINSLPDKEKIAYDIYGSGPEEEKLKALVGKYNLKGIVQFKGSVANNELPEIMSQYDVFIQPSFKETLGLSYFEALACGLPVILTKKTGAYEMIKEKDVYYLVDPYDPKSISECLENILQDRETLDKKARLAPKVASIASWEGFVDYFHEKYEEIVAAV